MDANVLKAIADPTRLQVVQILSKGELCACELPKLVKVSQPAISQHLHLLVDSGILKKRRDGAKRIYSLTKKGLKILNDVSGW